MRRYQTPEESKQGVRRPRLEADRRLPDPQPDPPRARVPDQGRARDLRRALHPPADRRDQEGRHPRRRADALLRGPDGELLPPGPRDARRQPRQDALRRARARRCSTRSSAATTAAPTSSSAATTPASATTTAPTTRSGSSTTSTSASSGIAAAVLRAHLLVQRLRGHGLGEDLPAPAGVASLPLGDEGPGDARATARSRRTSSRRDEVAEILIDAYRKESATDG